MGLLDWLTPKPPPDPATLARIEQAVDLIDPMIRQVSGYVESLAPVVKQAHAYCEELALAIPGPFPISRAAFASDPLVHSLFGSAEDVETMLATSQCVRDHLAGEHGVPADQCYALLGMRPRITAGFGSRLAGELVKHDEPQKTLTFVDHTLAEPSPDLDTAHARLADRMFEGLLKNFLAHVDEVREERQELRDAAAFERAKARSAGPESHTRRLVDLQDRLRTTTDALQPERLLKTLVDHLAIPQSILVIEPVKFWVDRFGILAEGDADKDRADPVRFVELTTRDQRRWVVMVVRIDRDEARAAVARFEERRRYIVI